jgi:DNA polymerase
MSLDLDRRQRAMLQEMGVRVWLPPAVARATVARAVESPVVSSASSIGMAQKEAVTELPGQREIAPSAANAVPGDYAEMDWPSLQQSIASCQACKLGSGRRAAVFGASDAPRQANWLVVGEPPDESEESTGVPFAGPVGRLLDNMLKAVGVSRYGGSAGPLARATAAYVTSVVKCRPAGVSNPGVKELATCEHYLRREVALVQPKVILALGRFAAQALLQGDLPEVVSIPLGKLRGKIFRYQGVPVIVSYHPSYLLRTPQDKARAWADLCLALETMGPGKK